MSFRLRIVLLTTALITLLFSVGGTLLIHTSFDASLEKEEQAAVDIHEMILRVVQYVGKDGTWMTEEELVSIIENLCQQDSIESLRLVHEGEIIYTHQKGQVVPDVMNEIADVEENEVQISYFILKGNETHISIGDELSNLSDKISGRDNKIEYGERYLQSSTKFVLNNRIYYLDTCHNLTDIYMVREEQIGMFQNIFLILSLIGSLASWLAATFITRNLRKLTRAAKEIGRGNLSYRSKIKSYDEAGELAEAFDQMAEKLEENITLLKEAAEQREMFMGAFTHELKTPMTSIIGYADLLRSQKLSACDQMDALNYIFSEGKRLENMSLKMLDLFVADKKEVEFKTASPGKLVSYTVKHLRNMFVKEGIEIVIQAESGTCLLEPDLFQTLVINLLDNARKAMEHGGKITVAVKMTDYGCTLYVIDEGKGIPQESLKHLTEAFYRVDKARARSVGSAGLGLALCEKIVSLHHGTMEFDSKEGVGTVVTVHLGSPTLLPR